MKRCVVCGFSTRAIAMYVYPLIPGEKKLPEFGDYSKHARVVGALDVDPDRIKIFNERQQVSIPAYAPCDFDRMIGETKPDTVIVAGPDVTHAEYIIKALKHNLDVITEKPMVINCAQAKAVMEAEKKSKGTVRVGFNFRYVPAHKYIKRLIMSGALGKITNIEFVDNLDTYHGASFFYRWNRDRSQSGGLTVHKACHHFDLINWLIDDEPEQVFAYGALNYFGKNSPYNPARNKRKMSLDEVKKKCPYYQKWFGVGTEVVEDAHMKEYNNVLKLPYRVQYPRELYIYDEDIAIEDTYSAVVRYRSGASMSYSFNVSAPWEGYILAINGIKGRIETIHYSDPSRCPFPASGRQTVTYIPLFGTRQVHDTPVVVGGHGGADDIIRHDMFIGITPESKELRICADSSAGADAVAVGEGIWRSVIENRPIDLRELFK